ncbi:MAG: hypothetical protein K6T75_04455 [Acetobacteraceae bacterium]|nr:hypothetical protein [Acetobacteraceae bacterium]
MAAWSASGARFQHRLVVELRLAGISNPNDANTFLPAFTARFNATFAVPPADPTPASRRPRPRPNCT